MIEKYIKASECEKYFYEHLDDNGMIGAMNAIDEMPAADVQPIKHGRWLEIPDDSRVSLCSECKHFGHPRFNFCPNCGARMIKEGDQDDE